MTPRRLDNLFSAAYEDEMTPIEEARFHTHMKSCAPCAAAYAEFKATVEELRGTAQGADAPRSAPPINGACR